MSNPPQPTSASTRVLVAFATRMGGTEGIATMIGDELRSRGLQVDVRPAGEVRDVDPYQVVVLGSALYARRWRRDAVRFLRRHRGALQGRTVRLFQSGPCGKDAAQPDQPEPAVVRRLRTTIDADPPVTFGGVLDPATARGFVAKRMAQGELAGDFRDPARIRRWAADLASTCTSAART
ncbi:flavodoxin domain-containing protein [Pseudonocardia sp. GCM10023141]|uniref:flavodoxin domain-containing protein n=1 Tax=Pseudonocardia sp. GCM10023141 TaxID=3252653 RepID=UPI00360F2BD5